jgi:protease-4
MPQIPIPGLAVDKGLTYSNDIVKYIQKLERKREVKAVVFEIDSPGGTPYASKEIGEAIKRLKKPTVAQIRERGASGAYWVASACDKIVADLLSEVGGIGVRVDRLDLTQLLKKIGIQIGTFATGEYKGMGSPTTSLTQKEKEFIESQIDTINQHFIEEIKSNRNIKDNEVLRNVISGRPYLGKEAKNLGLVDYLGDLTTATEIASELAGKKLKVKYKKERPSRGILEKLFSS